MAQGVYPGFRDMHQDAAHEFVDAQSEDLLALFAVVFVAEADVLAVHAPDLLGLERATQEVAGEVQQDAFAVAVFFFDANAPLFLVEALDQLVDTSFGLIRGQNQRLVFEGLFDAGLEFAPVVGFYGAHREQEVVLDRLPLIFRGQSACGDEGMDVGMQVELSSPGVQSKEDAGFASEVLFVTEHFHENFMADAELGPDEPGSVVLPESQVFVWQGEDEVVVFTR